MRSKLLLLLFLFVIAVSFGPSTKYLDTTLPVNERVKDLLSRMTIEEKASQMIFVAPGIDSLQIPLYNWWNEGLHGVARNGLATSFPQAIGLAATWDKQLMNQVANAISDEARAKYNIAISKEQHGRYQGLTYWSPNINIFRDPRWGRGQETYGEDPYLTGMMGVEFIKGLQGTDPNYYKVIATAKHFAVHSGPEPERHTFDATISDYDLYTTYLPAFKMSVVDGKVGSLMCAYNSLRGHACCSNDPLLNDILRNQWHFNGYVVSDCGAITDIFNTHKQANDAAEASAFAVKAGTDLECGFSYTHLVEAYKSGLVKQSDIDTSVSRLFTARFKLGMFDPPAMVPYSKLNADNVDSKEHRDLATKSALESIVLLKNNQNTLPLKKDVKTIAIIGPNANDVQCLLGNYNGFPSHTVTPLEGIKNKVSATTKVLYEPGCSLAANMPFMEVIAPKYFFVSGNRKANGLTAEYFSNTTLEGTPAYTGIDSLPDVMAWTGQGDFSVRWSGYLIPPADGDYNLGCWGGTDFKLYIDDSLIVADEGDPDNDYSYKSIPLIEGQSYKIRIETAVNSPKSPLSIFWSVPDAEKEKRALNAAKKADVIIMCMGLSPRLEGEEMNVEIPGFSGGDRTSLDLPASQEDLIMKMAALGKPIVLVLVNGSAVSINWANANIPAIVETWYGGQAAGHALADVLFGDYNPAGRLPVTFYKSVDQLPDFRNYNMTGRTYRYFTGEVLYPFGYGLSYTTFNYSNMKVSGNIKGSQPVTVSVDVKNTGSVMGEEVVQLYVKGKSNGMETDAIKSLKGFERISLKPGETKTVQFNITADALNYYKEGKGFTLDKGDHTLLIGSSSSDKDLKEIKVTVE